MTDEEKKMVRTFQKLNDLLLEAFLKDRDFSSFVDEDKVYAEPERAIRMLQQVADGIAEPEDYYYFQKPEAQPVRQGPDGQIIRSTR
ncbi:hypothetical protein [uncultured Parasutterella sp.]|uniref:hypothetical protein n=1 Tax=uncultured Parasutterella sp. TaxID=1263098 RepID=UPI00272A6BE9|nr:hypothetical protein [uncultured Parasutterella sp.]